MPRRLAWAFLLGFVGCAATDEANRAARQDSSASRRASQGRSPRDVVRTASNRDTIERAAVALARSADERDFGVIRPLLVDAAFLARLDDTTHRPTEHLARVLTALGERPAAESERLYLELLSHPAYELFDRKEAVLTAVTKIRPMSERTVAAIRPTNAEAYFAFNSRLLTANGSPRAMELFESMMLDRSVAVEERVDCLHLGVMPRRTDAAVLRSAEKILSRASERLLVGGVAESVFDYKATWFGRDRNPPKAPPWETASPEALQLALGMADKVVVRSDVDRSLRDTVRRSRVSIARLLAERRK